VRERYVGTVLARETSLRLLLEKHATSYTVVPFSDRSRTLLSLYATRTYT